MNWNKKKAYRFLHQKIRLAKCQCVVAHNMELNPFLIMIPEELFSSMIILDLLVDLELNNDIKKNIIRILLNSMGEKGLFTFYANKTSLLADVDDTSLAHTALTKAGSINPEIASRAVEAVIQNVTPEGIIKIWFGSSAVIDPAVCANAVYFIHLYGKGQRCKLTEDFIYQVITTNTYQEMEFCYPSEDTYLYLVSRLLDFPVLSRKFADPLNERLKKRINTTDNALDLSMRVICSNKLGISNDIEAEKLCRLQQMDGGWPPWALFVGCLGSFFGSREITTAFAIRALTGK